MKKVLEALYEYYWCYLLHCLIHHSRDPLSAQSSYSDELNALQPILDTLPKVYAGPVKRERRRKVNKHDLVFVEQSKVCSTNTHWRSSSLQITGHVNRKLNVSRPLLSRSLHFRTQKTWMQVILRVDLARFYHKDIVKVI